MAFSSDYRMFYLNDEPFFPSIGREIEDNIVPVKLLADPQVDLDWSGAKIEAIASIEQGKWILWQFCFGLEQGPLHLDNTAKFLSLTLAIDAFLKDLWPSFSERTFGASLYQGSLLIDSRFIWTSDLEKNYKEAGLDETEYCLEVFAEYLHRLASYFPDAILPFCFFESPFSCVKTAKLLSKQRFAHLHLAVKGSYQPLGCCIWENERAYFSSQETTVGILLPSADLSNPSILSRLEEIVLQCQQKPRIIPELLLNEQWDGLDTVYVIEEGLSQQGRRRLAGFAAAGGEIILT